MYLSRSPNLKSSLGCPHSLVPVQSKHSTQVVNVDVLVFRLHGSRVKDAVAAAQTIARWVEIGVGASGGALVVWSGRWKWRELNTVIWQSVKSGSRFRTAKTARSKSIDHWVFGLRLRMTVG